MVAKFVKFENTTCWVTGKCDGHEFTAMLMDQDCEQGIMKGRVLELLIDDVPIYRHQWITEPSPSLMPVFNNIINLLHNAPKRFY